MMTEDDLAQSIAEALQMEDLSDAQDDKSHLDLEAADLLRILVRQVK
jgi:hypothetical protein